MIKVMLEAVSDMLKIGGSDEISGFKVRVSCAKTILDKVIEGLDNSTTYLPTITTGDPLPIPSTTSTSTGSTTANTAKKVRHPDGKYKIVKDDNNKLVRVDGLPLDAKIELDGKVMTHAQAKGKSFISGRIL